MAMFAAGLAATGELRPEHTVDTAADVLWLAMDVRNYDWLVRERGWPAERFRRWYRWTLYVVGPSRASLLFFSAALRALVFSLRSTNLDAAWSRPARNSTSFSRACSPSADSPVRSKTLQLAQDRHARTSSWWMRRS